MLNEEEWTLVPRIRPGTSGRELPFPVVRVLRSGLRFNRAALEQFHWGAEDALCVFVPRNGSRQVAFKKASTEQEYGMGFRLQHTNKSQDESPRSLFISCKVVGKMWRDTIHCTFRLHPTREAEDVVVAETTRSGMA